MAEIDIVTATIAINGSLSGEVDIGTKSLVGLIVPATWIAASITFQVSPDGGTTWAVLMDPSTAGPYTIATVTVTGGLPAAVAVDPTKLRGFVSYKIQSGTNGTPVVQTTAAVVQLITRLAF
jgi:hypothetical protein